MRWFRGVDYVGYLPYTKFIRKVFISLLVAIHWLKK